jgi:hypothetical protein
VPPVAVPAYPVGEVFRWQNEITAPGSPTTRSLCTGSSQKLIAFFACLQEFTSGAQLDRLRDFRTET